VCCAPAGNIFAVYAADKIVRVFDFKTGKIKRKYDESIASYQRQAAAAGGVDGTSSTLDMGRKIAIEKELDATPDLLKQCTMAFDESGNFLIYGSLGGIKIVNVVTNTVAKVLGGNESGERFLTVALYQGIPKVDVQYLLSQKGAKASTTTVDDSAKAQIPDPTMFCTSLKKRRFYCFSRREPDESEVTRDVLNERPTEEERITATDTLDRSLAREAIIRTTRGDINLKLFAAECPKTIENFVTHARSGYYNNVIFHRVIKGFMLQVSLSLVASSIFYSLIFLPFFCTSLPLYIFTL
jgi:peptidylprolyl isomerase domain and WD repeat-containing protein 1